mmetsp:Transcript_12473/g.35035  ORF Transcript_12473/g.35035 Transcript_12473/m.35035 type:complete len:252 (+) Transcript_12473:478-1233(+)
MVQQLLALALRHWRGIVAICFPHVPLLDVLTDVFVLLVDLRLNLLQVCWDLPERFLLSEAGLHKRNLLRLGQDGLHCIGGNKVLVAAQSHHWLLGNQGYGGLGFELGRCRLCGLRQNRLFPMRPRESVWTARAHAVGLAESGVPLLHLGTHLKLAGLYLPNILTTVKWRTFRMELRRGDEVVNALFGRHASAKRGAHDAADCPTGTARRSATKGEDRFPVPGEANSATRKTIDHLQPLRSNEACHAAVRKV